AELALDLAPAAERELRAAAAGVEDDEPLGRATETEPGHRGEVREARLLLAGNDLDLHTAALANRVHERLRVGRDAQSGSADCGDLLGTVFASLVGHRGDRVGGPPHRLLLE